MSPLSPNTFSASLVLKLIWYLASTLSSSSGVVTVLLGLGELGMSLTSLVQNAGSR